MQSFDATPQLLAALLDGMEAGLCAFDRDGVITHWNTEAVRILGWTPEEAVGRKGFAGWAARTADAEEVRSRLLAVMDAAGRQVHEFALLTKDGRRVLVRTQSAAVQGADGRPAGVYCAFSEVHAQIDLERSIALSEALFDDASSGVVLVDADLRPVVVNAYAARVLHTSRDALLGRPLGDFLDQGVEELESAMQHVLAEGAPPAPSELWVGLREEGGTRCCWRSSFVRLGSPLGEEPVPLGVGWLFHDITDAKVAEREAAVLRFRSNQLQRAARAVAECREPMEAATCYVDFALAGFAENALLDVLTGDGTRLVRAAATPSGGSGPCLPVAGGIPVRYGEGHPALQAVARTGAVRASFGALAGSEPASRAQIDAWSAARRWPDGTVHGLCAVLRSRGRTLGTLTFLRGMGRRPFDRVDAAFAEDVALRVAAALDLAPRGR
ncbi:PAS domain-containing protein [Streptomyces sp. NPDC088354]|uniref:PAS domain-containing protein n=1 Tax=unclassified Streptomyces TaxID=2593676 RepID=UPI0029B72F18|nr:PAS domain-containing protein [Streptomyces sp. MI02-7b]MDX3076043.1 PAS domain-containing protein [Streptomyces sp. MI02-7b]